MSSKRTGFKEGDEVIVSAVVTRIGEDGYITIRIDGVGTPITLNPERVIKTSAQ